MQSLGIVIPVYLNALSLAKLLSKLIETLEENRINYKIILVNDGSPDSSWQIIEKLCKENKNITGIALSKNFGQFQATRRQIPAKHTLRNIQRDKYVSGFLRGRLFFGPQLRVCPRNRQKYQGKSQQKAF